MTRVDRGTARTQAAGPQMQQQRAPGPSPRTAQTRPPRTGSSEREISVSLFTELSGIPPKLVSTLDCDFLWK